jgi:enolase-phosphatase E1
MGEFLRSQHHRPEVQRELADVSKLAQVDAQDLVSCTKVLREWIKQDKKIAPLKNLQGLIWQEGYQTEKIKGHVYPEVRSAFETWTARGKKLAIYSSGSVLAQKLIFGYSTSGDLTGFLSHYIDTVLVGHKQSIESYMKIASILGVEAKKILFLSDRQEELVAATQAGMMCVQVERPEDKQAQNNLTAPVYLKIDDFLKLFNRDFDAATTTGN